MSIFLIVVSLGYFGVFAAACSNNQPDGDGIEILGTTYNCKYLRDYFDEDKYVGIYENRKFYCEQQNTDCCETCSKILRCNDAPVNGVYLAEIYFSCAYLLKEYPEDEKVGIYENRKSLCAQNTTNCCETCQKVLAQVDNPSTTTLTPTTTVSRSEKTPTGTKTTMEFKDNCLDNCLWIADGQYGPCSWLLEPLRPEYDIRHSLCSTGMAPGCQRTCHVILTEHGNGADDNKPTTPTVLPVCEDTYMMVEKLSYACSDLANPSSSIYNNRHTLCASDSTACCVTCRQVKDEKPSAVIKYSDPNMIDKTGDVIEVVPAAAMTDISKSPNVAIDLKTTGNPGSLKSTSNTESANQYGLLSFFQKMKQYSEEMQRENKMRRDAFSLMIANIISMFKDMKQSETPLETKSPVK